MQSKFSTLHTPRSQPINQEAHSNEPLESDLAAHAKSSNVELLGSAASEIAHDFNNLLTVILGNLSLALRSRGLNSQLCEQLTAAKLAALRAHELAQQLHSFAEAAAEAGAAISEPQEALLPFAADAETIQGARVLVADDEEALCELLCDALSPLGCEVCSTQDGSRALALYQEALREGRRFNVVISDLRMPSGIGGLELMRGLQAMDPGVRVILSSGHATDDVTVQHRDHGFCGVLSKPYDLATLERVIAAAMLPDAANSESATTSGWRAFPTTHALQA